MSWFENWNVIKDIAELIFMLIGLWLLNEIRRKP